MAKQNFQLTGYENGIYVLRVDGKQIFDCNASELTDLFRQIVDYVGVTTNDEDN